MIWVLHANSRIGGRSDWELFFNTIVADEVRERTLENLAEEQTVWTDLTTASTDLTLLKNRYSALIPGSSQLERTLRGMGIDTILIAGTKTNVCCESTARDAMMLDFKVVMVEDCCAALGTVSASTHRARHPTSSRPFGLRVGFVGLLLFTVHAKRKVNQRSARQSEDMKCHGLKHFALYRESQAVGPKVRCAPGREIRLRVSVASWHAENVRASLTRRGSCYPSVTPAEKMLFAMKISA